jgi:hypothetical protein
MIIFSTILLPRDFAERNIFSHIFGIKINLRSGKPILSRALASGNFWVKNCPRYQFCGNMARGTSWVMPWQRLPIRLPVYFAQRFRPCHDPSSHVPPSTGLFSPTWWCARSLFCLRFCLATARRRHLIWTQHEFTRIHGLVDAY